MAEKQSQIEWAERTRANQGSSCEMDLVLEDYEDDYEARGIQHVLFKRCKKHPGHKDFVPLPQLELQHLPERCRRPDVLRLVKKYAATAVKLIVRYTSKDRPDHFAWPELRGKKTPRCGSGAISVLKRKNGGKPMPFLFPSSATGRAQYSSSSDPTTHNPSTPGDQARGDGGSGAGQLCGPSGIRTQDKNMYKTQMLEENEGTGKGPNLAENSPDEGAESNTETSPNVGQFGRCPVTSGTGGDATGADDSVGCETTTKSFRQTAKDEGDPSGHPKTQNISSGATKATSGGAREEEDEEFVLKVTTAAHVVFNEEEALQTIVELFYDDDEDRSSVILAKGIMLTEAKMEFDRTTFLVRLFKSELLPTVLERLCTSSPGGLGEFPDLSFCVSHPHGVAKRVTFGDVKSETLLGGPHIQHETVGQLVSIAQFRLGVEERKLLYYYFYCIKLENTITEPSAFGLSPLDQKREIMKHLVGKGLIKCPNNDELVQLGELFGENLEIDNETVVQMFHDKEYINGHCDAQSAPTGPQEDIAGAENFENPQIPAPSGSHDQNFAHRLWNVVKEQVYKEAELDYGKAIAEGLTDICKTKYFLSTCPGSSGADVVCLNVVDGKRRISGVPHSLGTGISGGGSAVYL
ncbi:uncharacterized protein LOC101846987 isoform X1 [Aplysia californica]|uniref:Uncharacterized protein LOC101846987 isoform X1 n=1 Tax=Aplysia californica TaxID=6500 RepID=A0ABM0K319_APLCA|nr:uncharacterized protein LOC101846987 isoform X1 [Aplysia californica]